MHHTPLHRRANEDRWGSEMKRIAVDFAKSVYQVAESVRSGQVAQRRRLSRVAFRRYIQEQSEPVEWLMEACGSAHYWGRLVLSLGHRVKLIHPRYVRPYRRRNKTDRNDCDAILEAARYREMYPVPVKSHQQCWPKSPSTSNAWPRANSN